MSCVKTTYDGDFDEKLGGFWGFVHPLRLVHQEDFVPIPGHHRENHEEKYSYQ